MFIQQIFIESILCAGHCDKDTMLSNTNKDSDLKSNCQKCYMQKI